MIFTFDYWNSFCRDLHESNVHSITAKQLMHDHPSSPYVVLKHDVETNVGNALRMAEIEHKWGHCASYYVQAYLLDKEENVAKLLKMQEMGHEISYHYDVMDANGGHLPSAILDFESKLELFKKHGFYIETLCQHGNPVVERKGYTSNRDFFRSPEVQAKYPDLADIMVDFKQKAASTTDYLYFSDAGRKFKLIYDPINNDLVPSDDKNIPFENLKDLWTYVLQQNANSIISTHPHRWVASKTKFMIKTAIFVVLRAIAKVTMKIPFLKKLMSKYYYLAKKL